MLISYQLRPRMAEMKLSEFIDPKLKVNPTEHLEETQRDTVAIRKKQMKFCTGLMQAFPECATEIEITERPLKLNWFKLNYDFPEYAQNVPGRLAFADLIPRAPECPIIATQSTGSGTQFAAGVIRGLPIVREDLRGMGIGALIHLICDRHALFPFAPTDFSKQGHAARVSAHRQACIDAMQTGRSIHPENLKRYSKYLHHAATRRDIRPHQARL